MATTIEELEARVSRVEAALEHLESREAEPPLKHERIGMTMEELKRSLEERPAQGWTEAMWADFTKIVGAGEGPPDLAENKWKYLHDPST